MNKNRGMSLFFFHILPKSLFSRLFGYLALIPLPGAIIRPLIRWYSKKYGVIDEYVTPPKGFKNVNDFFTRKLAPGARPIDASPKSVVSPVDARIDQFGRINTSRILQAKGVDYSLYDLVPSKMAEYFLDGQFMTLYLNPGDYHRIHAPLGGKILGYYNLPGKLYTVQEFMVEALQGLFSLNERLITYIQSRGMVAVCKIGAMNVGRMTLSYANERTNSAIRRPHEYLFPESSGPEIAKGDEIGIFNLGSTIILLFEKDFMKFDAFVPGTKIRMGQRIGTMR